MKMITVSENAKIFSNVRIGDAVEQIKEVAFQYPDSVIRVMPDYHVGKGCTIGLTMHLKEPIKSINPELVGVDIGCGVLSYKIQQNIDLPDLDDFIHKSIPAGHHCGEYREDMVQFLEQLHCYDELYLVERLASQLGTLGGGNHFIEVDEDEQHNQYITVHSGSRNIGKQVCDIYRWKFFCGEDFWEDYVHDLHIVQQFAHMNRAAILDKIVEHFGLTVVTVIESVHNYFDGTYVRKGAIDASLGKLCIIPLNMRDGTIIGVGRGNEDWNCSAPHGAGRVLSRAQARKRVSLEDFRDSMQGIYTTTCNNHTIDESAFAYKPVEEILDVIGDTISITEIIRPVYNFKG